MTLSDLASIGSFVSGIAVVFSFVFLAMQLRQNAHNQRATVHNERAALVQELVIASLSADMMEIRARGNMGDPALDIVQSQRFLFLSLSTFRLLEEFFYQHRDGMLDEARWETNVRRVCSFLPAPGFRAAWRTLSGSFGPDFIQWFDAMMRDVPASPDANAAVAVWKDFARQELEEAQSAGAAG